MHKESSLPAIVEADGWPPLVYKYGEARAPVVNLFLLCPLLLSCSTPILSAVSGKRHLWDHKNPYYGCRGAGL